MTTNTMKIVNIEWETDGIEVDLPKETIVSCDDTDDIAEELSSTYGWLVKGFDVDDTDE
jgi:hypothetical protein